MSNCLRGASLFALMLAMVQPAWAGDVACGVGQSVQGEMGGGGAGDIVEVGTARPHVGWYRIVFSWNAPNGDWYDPSLLEMHPAGTNDRCVVGAPVATPVPQDTAAAPAPASPDAQSSSRCLAGRRVVNRQNQAGNVVGESNGMCVVRLDDGRTQSSLPWMLSDEGAAAAAAGGLAAGTYTCSTNNAGFFPIRIVDSRAYEDRAGHAGSYQLDAPSGRISFGSGSLQAFHSKLLGPGKFGLSADSSSFFATVCNFKR